MPSSEIIFKYAIISRAAIDSDSDTRRCHLVDTFHILPFQLNKSLQLHISHVATRVNVTTEPEIILLLDFVTVSLYTRVSKLHQLSHPSPTWLIRDLARSFPIVSSSKFRQDSLGRAWGQQTFLLLGHPIPKNSYLFSSRYLRQCFLGLTTVDNRPW
jgi:hypothetical protein